MCFGKVKTPPVPPTPPPPPDPPQLADPANLAVRDQTMAAARARRGSTSTILAGGGQLGSAGLGASKTLLGQ